jgi:ectoine hydroxylase
MALTAEELAFYREKGYVVKRGLFPQDLMQRLSEEIEGLHERMAEHAPETVHVSWEHGLAEGRPPRIRQLMHSEKVSPILDAMSRSEEILSIMEQLIGPDLYLFHSKLMMKAAYDGTFTPWHQDWGYWRSGSNEPTQVNCMLAIDANTEENGALRFVEGSHRRGPLDHKDFKTASFSLGLEGDISAFESTLCLMEPGDGVFFAPLVIHGSAPNRSPYDRRANTFAFDRAGNQRRGEMPPENRRRASS